MQKVGAKGGVPEVIFNYIDTCGIEEIKSSYKGLGETYYRCN